MLSNSVSLPPKEEGSAVRCRPSGSSLLDVSNPMLLASAIAIDWYLPYKRMHATKYESFVLPPSPPNGKYPEVIDSCLPFGHPGHNIPPPDLGRLIIIMSWNFRAAGSGGAARDSDNLILRHNILLSDIRKMLGSERECVCGNCCCIPLAFFDQSIAIRHLPPACRKISLLIPLRERWNLAEIMGARIGVSLICEGRW